jgi:O-acetyl-ADP-ribose deacetylase (regulator of RNase III)
MPTVTVEVASIIAPALGAHAIVNPSNPRLLLDTGAGTAIREVCGGDAYQQLVWEARDQMFGAPLESGDCLVTDSCGAAAFRWVLHVPAIDRDREDPETGGVTGPTRVCDCTFAFLDHAADLSLREGLGGKLVVASPLLGAGERGLVAADSARAMTAALRDFLRSGAAAQLLTIKLVVPSVPLASLVIEALEV